MRHRVSHRKLGRVTEHRISMLRNQAEALLRHERIETTVPKAKELRPFVERIITIAKRGIAAGTWLDSAFPTACAVRICFRLTPRPEGRSFRPAEKRSPLNPCGPGPQATSVPGNLSPPLPTSARPTPRAPGRLDAGRALPAPLDAPPPWTGVGATPLGRGVPPG